MAGDISKSTFAALKHYRSVLMQQGRVQTDADWNEEFDILAHREECEIVDAFGPVAAPWYDSGFHVVSLTSQLYPPEQILSANASPPSLQPGGDFYISAGRLYVDGILCENDRICTYLTQQGSDPHLPRAPRPSHNGYYLVYLDVFLRDITWLDDPDIREVALGGPDTATRAKTEWRVKIQPVEPNSNCASQMTIAEEIAHPVTLQARAEPDPLSDDPCVVAPGAGYRGLTNQLYRVEIHQGGAPGTATFKWSRDDGAIRSAVLAQSSNDFTLANVVRDPALGFANGKWVEFLDDARIRAGAPGPMARINAVNGDVITVDPGTAVPSGPIVLPALSLRPSVRLWDAPPATVTQPSTNGGFIALENGVEIKFSNANIERLRTADYWEIPARVATAVGPAGILWPPGGDPSALDQPPRGIRHHFAHLAVGEFNGSAWKFEDCRKRFVPASEDVNLFFLGGDGQVAPVHGPVNRAHQLPEMLSVGVSIGELPLAGAQVEFKVIAGSGQVNGAAVKVITTGADGIAKVTFVVDGVTSVQQVTARLLNPANLTRHLPVTFTARLLYADGVLYDPKDCVDLKDADTVQKAIDKLCKLLHAPPAIHIESVHALNGLTIIANDGSVGAPLLAAGIVIECDKALARLDVGPRPVCTVSLDLPWPATTPDQQFWGASEVGYQTIRLAGTTGLGNAPGVGPNGIVWAPQPSTAAWLTRQLPHALAVLKVDRVLVHLHIKGDFVWEGADNTIYLDGTTVGKRVPQTEALQTLEHILPSGDKRRVGDFDMWFWLSMPPQKRLRVTTIGFFNPFVGNPVAQINVPLAADAPTPRFLSTALITTMQISFNRDILPGSLVDSDGGQSILLEYQQPGAGYQHLKVDLAMLSGSTSVVVVTAKIPSTLRAVGNYRLTVFGQLSSDTQPIRATGDVNELDGIFDPDPAHLSGTDFTFYFVVANPTTGGNTQPGNNNPSN